MPSSPDVYRRSFYNALTDDGTLGPDDARFVDLHSGVGVNDEVELLARHIQFSAQRSSCQLFTGYRGSGKSVELRRLKQLLERDGYQVLLFDLEDYLNVSAPIDVNEFLMAVAFGVDRAATDLGWEPTKERWRDRAWRLLNTEVDAKATVKLPGVDIEAELRSGELSFKERMREAMAGRLSALVEAVNAFVKEIADDLMAAKTDCPGVVVLVDSLDHARGSVDFHAVKESIRTLFEVHGRSLGLTAVHLVYTVPVYLKFMQPDGAGVVRVLRAIKVTSRDGAPTPAGIETMTRLVAARAPEGDWQELLGSADTLQRLIQLSGGHLRDFLRLVAEITLRSEALPAGDAVVDRAIVEIRNQFLPIPLDDQEQLRRVARDKRCDPPSDAAWEQIADLFDHHYVLSYQNGGDEWYDVHPILRDHIGSDTTSS